MALKLPVIENAAQIGMAGEADAVLVIDLAFGPVGRSPDRCCRRQSDFRVGHGYLDLGQQILLPVAQDIDHAETGGAGLGDAGDNRQQLHQAGGRSRDLGHVAET